MNNCKTDLLKLHAVLNNEHLLFSVSCRVVILLPELEIMYLKNKNVFKSYTFCPSSLIVYPEHNTVEFISPIQHHEVI